MAGQIQFLFSLLVLVRKQRCAFIAKTYLYNNKRNKNESFNSDVFRFNDNLNQNCHSLF